MQRDPTILWTPCAAHCPDLMFKDIGKLEWVKSCVDKAKNICKFIYNHALVLNIMRDYTNKRELARPSITRFVSHFIMLKSLFDSRLDFRCMFVGLDWTSSSYATTPAGIDVAKFFFDEEGFWEPCKEIVEVIEPLLVLLRVADGEKSAMGYIYEGMDRAKEAIRAKYARVEKYGPMWNIIDRRWQNQHHRPIHVVAYYLNLAYRFCDDFKADEEVLSGLYTIIGKMVGISNTDTLLEMDAYNNSQGSIFSSQFCKEGHTKLQLDSWWQMFGPTTKNLQKIAICILSQPCSTSGCECNWSIFEHIHLKRRNKLSVERMDNLVFVHYNLRHRTREILDSDSSPITVEEIDPQFEWITKATDPIFDDGDIDWID